MDNSTLNQLPVELRLQIYKHLFTSSTPIDLCALFGDPTNLQYGLPGLRTYYTPLELAITKICRHLRSEAVPLFFSTSEFRLHFKHVANLYIHGEATGQRCAFKALRNWLGTIGTQNACAIRHLTLHLGALVPHAISNGRGDYGHLVRGHETMLRAWDAARQNCELLCQDHGISPDAITISFDVMMFCGVGFYAASGHDVHRLLMPWRDPTANLEGLLEAIGAATEEAEIRPRWHADIVSTYLRKALEATREFRRYVMEQQRAIGPS